ncbi:MAG: hypothetical protein J6Q81_03915, partial [Lentisphaeria bacterium]|nr:hypothetical protein [Lentisphaeria bacterium]
MYVEYMVHFCVCIVVCVCGGRVRMYKSGMHLFFAVFSGNKKGTPQMAGNSNLQKANKAKQDEFYTQ